MTCIPRRRRAREVKLVLTSAAVMFTAGCDSGPSQPRYVYANLQDCMREWYRDACDWEPDGTYVAPDDDWDHNMARTSFSGKSKAIRVIKAKRGGFGSFARSFGSSRS